MDYLGELERLLADLYPYRWPILAGVLILFAAVIAFGYFQGWHVAIWRHKLMSGIIAIVILAFTIPAGDYLLSPLFERSFLEEPSPIMAAPGDATEPGLSPEGDAPADDTPEEAGMGDDTASEFKPRVIASGQWEGADSFHFARGQALLIESAHDVYTLRVEEFSVRNGPDLFVYLSPDSDPDDTDRAVNLGELKATDGAFNYEVPPGMDVSQFQSAIVWCRRFSVLFGVATLTTL